jgi:bile acid:Na+ symporter, BASS family
MNPAKIVAAVMLVTLTFGAGLEINRAHLAATFKNVSLDLRALFANFIAVPIYGVLLARAFRLDTAVATGFLLMAIAPGVPFVLLGARKKGGRLALAVVMAVGFPLLSILTVPITASLVLPPDQRALLPVGQFVTTLLVLQFIPLFAGLLLGERLPSLAEKIARPVRIVFVLSLVALLVLLGPRMVSDIVAVHGSNGLYAMACIVILSMITGYLLGGPDERERRTLSIGTALRNIGLCAVVATASFGVTSRVASAVMAYLIVQILLTGIVGVFFTRAAKAEAAIGKAPI